jgi:hypothetical protein
MKIFRIDEHTIIVPQWIAKVETYSLDVPRCWAVNVTLVMGGILNLKKFIYPGFGDSIGYQAYDAISEEDAKNKAQELVRKIEKAIEEVEV